MIQKQLNDLERWHVINLNEDLLINSLITKTEKNH
jgi:hypothetical protein